MDAKVLANLAPYSFFNAVSGRSPMVLFSSSERSPGDFMAKDTLQNIPDTKQFVVNLATAVQQTEMNESNAAAPASVDEFDAVGLEKLPSHLIARPRVKGAPVHLECQLERFVDLSDGGTKPGTVLTIGLVFGVHIDEAAIVDGKVDIARVKVIAR